MLFFVKENPHNFLFAYEGMFKIKQLLNIFHLF